MTKRKHKGDGVAHIVGQAGGKFKPFRDRTIHSRRHKCPTCGAEPGDQCVTQAGTPYGGGNGAHHRTRREAAIRAMHEAEESA